LYASPVFAAPAANPPATRDSSRSAIDLRLPADIVYPHGSHPDSSVVFSHRTHVEIAQNRCTGCHPAAFRMLTRGPVPRHGDMNAGGSCGACHDGKQAFGVREATACASCHSGPNAAPAVLPAGATGADSAQAALKLPRSHTYPPSADSQGPVTFRHKTHVKSPADCATCHPKPFRRAATPPLPNGGMHEAQACGSCHDGKKSFATDDDATCSRCHKESGARP
jgi:c(7)-type cytochrome triheme protein